jgi:hypothetical protein
MIGMTCDDCGLSTKEIINCEGCPDVVCRSCYEHDHSGHHPGEVTTGYLHLIKEIRKDIRR